MGPGDLDRALNELKVPFNPNVIIGLESRDDAGVYRLTEDLAIVEHIDFFTPIVDDPYYFGQIAVANALSDVYAKGGRPLTAMNVVCFPSETMDISILGRILKGGLDKLSEANVVLLGGHSVVDRELKYGLSITGVVHPEKVITKAGARAGDVLVLTKPLGIGIISTAMKQGHAENEVVALATRQMTTLNKRASELMLETDVHACTDVTGFGLLGHTCEMTRGIGIGMTIHASKVPLLPKVREYAQMKCLPGATYRNKEFYSPMIEAQVPDETVLILFDPQTSGGLLISLPAKQGEALVKKMHEEGLREAAIIGEVVDEPKGKVKIIL